MNPGGIGGGAGGDPGGGAMQRGADAGNAAGGSSSPFSPQQSTNNVPQGPANIPAVTHLLLQLQARNLSAAGSSANSEFANYIQEMIRTNTNLFVAEGTVLTNKIEQVGSTNVSYNFEMVLQLKTPLIQKDLTIQPEETDGGDFAGDGGQAKPSF